MKAFQVRRFDQKLLTSSCAKSTPPMGALNTAAMPAEMPAVTRSRCSCSKPGPVQAWYPGIFVAQYETNTATRAPICTMGPSRPMGAPEAMARQFPSTFTRNVFTPKIPRVTQPFRNAFVSGIPEAAAMGAIPRVARIEAPMKTTDSRTKTTSAVPLSEEPSSLTRKLLIAFTFMLPNAS